MKNVSILSQDSSVKGNLRANLNATSNLNKKDSNTDRVYKISRLEHNYDDISLYDVPFDTRSKHFGKSALRAVESQLEYHEDFKKMINKLNDMYEVAQFIGKDEFTYVEKARTGLFVCWLGKKLLLQDTKKFFDSHNKDSEHFKVKRMRIGKLVVSIIKEKSKTKVWIPQVGVREVVDKAITSIQSIVTLYKAMSSQATNMFTKQFWWFILDVADLLLRLKSNYFTLENILASFISLYTLNNRYHDIFKPQTTSVSDMLTGFAMMGLPTHLLDKIKSFTLLTGKRIFDSEVIMDTILAIVETLIKIIEYMAEPVDGYPLISREYVDKMITFIQHMAGGLLVYKKSKEVCRLYTEYVRSPQMMFDPAYRAKVVELYTSVNGDAVFEEYIANTNNKYFVTTWNLFKNNIIKSVHAFEESRRDEPICIVFEGNAGSGKSVMMNLFVDVLREAQYSVYCHAIPSVDDGKDFYDDYQNQDVFVIDDVGQQGVSQWRTIINFVSPVKYPLPCAQAQNKNTKFFNSKVIVCTTNHLMTLGGFTKTDCIAEPEALFRRCHVIKVDRDTSVKQFAQTLRYFKFDHIHDHTWKNEFLFHNYHKDMPKCMENKGIGINRKNMMYVYKVFKHLMKVKETNVATTMESPQFSKDIIADTEDLLYDAQLGFSDILNTDRYLIPASWKNIYDEWLLYFSSKALGFLQEGMTMLSKTIRGLLAGIECTQVSHLAGAALGSLTLVVIGTMVYKYFFPSEEIEEYRPQVASIDDERVCAIKKHIKYVVIKEDTLDRSNDGVSNAVVSGQYLLLPAHAHASGKYIDVYTSYDHFLQGHKEMENVLIKEVRAYPASDLAVFSVCKAIPLWKKCHNLFVSEHSVKSLAYLVNAQFAKPLILGQNLNSNDQEVTYHAYKEGNSRVDFRHEKHTGYITDYSANGACGSVVVDSNAGIVAFHVAGSSKHGFCVSPPRYVRDEIREIMLSGIDPTFDIDVAIHPNSSGVRLRYTEPVKISHAVANTSFVKTPLHIHNNDSMRELCRSVIDDKLVSTEETKIDEKAPPNFKNMGSPATLLKNISKKTMKHQGYITSDEREYLKKCILTMLPTSFTDISDEECAFGSSDIPALNKESSNGYGCYRDKKDYFDFENKKILPTMIALAEKFAVAAGNKDYDYNLFMSKETFKDELRKSTKINEPRTFRVMPLGHIWWTKKICGQLIKHFKTHMHKYGVCVGLNPYRDFSKIYNKFKQYKTHGDIDFGKWDGSIMQMLMMLICECFTERYSGQHSHILEYVFVTMANSFVLVSDEMWATTHGLPSGTWLTLLLNCLLNKCLTALTLKRNKPNPTVDDFLSIVDYVVGDDKAFATPDHLAPYFNLLTVAKVAEALGMDCTNGDKTPITRPTQELHKLTFVKRHFRQHHELQSVVGVLSVDTILNTLQWMDATREPEEVMQGKINAVQIEAYLHSRVLFERVTQVCKETYPYMVYFDEDRVKVILNNDNAYYQVMNMMGKDITYTHLVESTT